MQHSGVESDLRKPNIGHFQRPNLPSAAELGKSLHRLFSSNLNPTQIHVTKTLNIHHNTVGKHKSYPPIEFQHPGFHRTTGIPVPDSSQVLHRASSVRCAEQKCSRVKDIPHRKEVKSVIPGKTPTSEFLSSGGIRGVGLLEEGRFYVMMCVNRVKSNGLKF